MTAEAASAARSRILKAGIAAAVGVAFLIGLGSWQLARLRWKEALIAEVAERMGETPAPAPVRAAWPGLDLAGWSYRRVTLTGAFEPTKAARIYTVLSENKGPYGGPGYFLLAPFRLTAGGVVIVNRGFAPQARVDVAPPPPAGDVEIAGVLREPEDRNAFTPADDPAKGIYFARDPAAIAAGLGVGDAAPFTVDQETGAPGAIPQGGETRVAFPNRHLEYALTWYGLAGALVAVFLAFSWRTLKEE